MACVPCYISAVPRIDDMARKQLGRESRQRLKIGAVVILAMLAYFAFRVWVADTRLEQDEPVFEFNVSDIE